MKRFTFAGIAAILAVAMLGCGPSAEEQEKAKQEILKIETANASVDSTEAEVAKTSQELDDLLNQLNAK